MTFKAKRVYNKFRRKKISLTDVYAGSDGDSQVDWLLQDIMVRIKVNIKCLAILNDRHNQYIFKDNFFQNLGNIPVLKILVQPSEDLMSPNYSTLSVVQQMQREGCNVYIIFLSNANQIIRLLTFGDRHRLLNSRANFVMMFDKRLFQSNLHYLWKKIINIVFIHKYEGSNQFELYSSIFPIQNLGQLTTPPLVDIWRSGKFIQNGQKIFVDKISDLNKNSLNVVTFQHIPSVIEKGEYSNDCTANKNILRFGGVEIEILKCLSEALHFLPRVYEVESDIKWGKRQPNGSFSGLIGELLNGKADIALGNLYHSPYYLELIDLSIPYHTECLTFITPESRTDSSWKTLVLPFKFNMWAGILISLLLAGFIFLVLAKFHRHLERNNYNPSISKINYQGLKPKLIGICRKIYLKTNTEIQLTIDTEVQSCQYNKNINKIFCVTQSQHEGLYQFEEIENSILYTYSMLLLVSLPKLPTGWALRLMTGWWWYYCLLVVVSYRASMTAILANPAPRVTIDTLQELAASPIHCGGWNDADKEFFTTSIDSDGRKVGLKFEIVNSIEASIAKVAAGSYAYYENIYFLQHERIKYLLHNNRSVPSGKNGDNIADDRLLHIMSDCIIKMPVSIGLQKNSPLKPKTDYVLQRIIETGLIKKWLNDVMFNTVAAESSFIFEEIKAFMDLKKLYGGLVALAIGYVISNLLLVFELIHWYYFVQKHPLFDKYSLTTYYQRS